jgi:hypothetical protein
MRKRTLGAVLLAGLVISGTGAFTAANDMTGVTGGTNNVAGYGTAVVSGATVTGVHYNVNATDQSKVDSVVFNTTEDLSGKTAQLKLTNSKGAAPTQTSTCTPAAGLLGASNTITCVFKDATLGTPSAVSIASFDGENLTVTQ